MLWESISRPYNRGNSSYFEGIFSNQENFFSIQLFQSGIVLTSLSVVLVQHVQTLKLAVFLLHNSWLKQIYIYVDYNRLFKWRYILSVSILLAQIMTLRIKLKMKKKINLLRSWTLVMKKLYITTCNICTSVFQCMQILCWCRVELILANLSQNQIHLIAQSSVSVSTLLSPKSDFLVSLFTSVLMQCYPEYIHMHVGPTRSHRTVINQDLCMPWRLY